MKCLAILGASGHAKVVAEIAELNGWQVFFFDDAFPSLTGVEHWAVQGTLQNLLAIVEQFDGAFVAIGNNQVRLQKLRQLRALNVLLPTLVHPSAVVSRYGEVAQGCVVMANAVINPFVKIGLGCIVNTAATIDHDCVLADAVHVSPGVHLAGRVSVGLCSWIGVGACVKQGVAIGEGAVVGAGAAVVANVNSHITVVGVPAKPLELVNI